MDNKSQKSNDLPQEVQAETQQNGPSRPQQQSESLAMLYLTPMNDTFEQKAIALPFHPDVLRIGRQTNSETLPTPQNGYFDSKVMSRSHAEIWADNSGKVWIRDAKSSNGTYINGQRLSREINDLDQHELREQDMLELGIDILSEDQETIVHHKVAARVEHVGFQ
jgi:pSer/pThr/pTyr-binding forkhead associated (FHA) protein